MRSQRSETIDYATKISAMIRQASKYDAERVERKTYSVPIDEVIAMAAPALRAFLVDKASHVQNLKNHTAESVTQPGDRLLLSGLQDIDRALMLLQIVVAALEAKPGFGSVIEAGLRAILTPNYPNVPTIEENRKACEQLKSKSQAIWNDIKACVLEARAQGITIAWPAAMPPEIFTDDGKDLTFYRQEERQARAENHMLSDFASDIRTADLDLSEARATLERNTKYAEREPERYDKSVETAKQRVKQLEQHRGELIAARAELAKTHEARRTLIGVANNYLVEQE